MSRRLRYVSLIGLCLLCSLYGRAERDTIQHAFTAMNTSPRTIEFYEGNTIGVTPLLTYHCSNGADFGLDKVYNAQISIRLEKKNSTVTTTPAVEELRGFWLKYVPLQQRTDIIVQVSRDSITWTPITGADRTNNYGEIRAKLPKGTYYIQVINPDSKNAISIYEFRYMFEHCNCFEYIAE